MSTNLALHNAKSSESFSHASLFFGFPETHAFKADVRVAHWEEIFSRSRFVFADEKIEERNKPISFPSSSFNLCDVCTILLSSGSCARETDEEFLNNFHILNETSSKTRSRLLEMKDCCRQMLCKTKNGCCHVGLKLIKYSNPPGSCSIKLKLNNCYVCILSLFLSLSLYMVAAFIESP